MKMFAFLLKASRGGLVVSVLAGTLSAASGVALIALIQAELGRPEASNVRIGLAFAGLCLLAALTRSIAQVAMVQLGQGSVTRLALLLCRKILALPLAQFEATEHGALLAALTEDIAIVTHALLGVPLLCINMAIVAACLLYVGWLSPLVLICGLVLALPGVSLYLVLASRGIRSLRAARASRDVLVTDFHSLIEGFRELKQNHARREAFLNESLEPAAENARRETATGLTLFALAEGWGQFAFFAFIGAVLFVLPALEEFPRATQVGVVLVVLYLNSPLDVLMTWLPALGRAQASLLKIEALFPALDALESEAHLAARPLGTKTLQLDGLTYEYPAEADTAGFVLGPIDLTLQPGELVFLAGGNGSGKTTLVKLLAGLYAPAKGQVLLDGEPLASEDREAYRQLFSVVFADGHVFQDLFGLTPDVCDQPAKDGLTRLGLVGRVEISNGRFSTLDLSQGQRKRLALLTAILEDRPICVFDEWAANQDARFKRFFYLELLPELKARGKAVLVITHDEDYYHAADRVVRLHEGLLEEPVQAVAREQYL